MATVKRSNPKAFEKLNFRIKELAGIETKVGWFETAKYPDGTSVAYVAAIQELGANTGHGVIPPRPFMRPTVAEEKKAWVKLVGDGAKEAIKGDVTMFTVMDALGQKAEADIAATITHITAPPLSPVTIELRAMKKANPNLVITLHTVGIAAAKVNQPGYQKPTVSDKPLNDTGVMLATLTHVTETE